MSTGTEPTTSHDILRELPAYMLGHGTETTPEQARDRLQAIGQYEPKDAHWIAERLLKCALELIAAGHPRPREIAAAALVVNSARFLR